MLDTENKLYHTRRSSAQSRGETRYTLVIRCSNRATAVSSLIHKKVAAFFQIILINSNSTHLAGLILGISLLYCHRGYSQTSGLPEEVYCLVSSGLPLQLHLFKEDTILQTHGHKVSDPTGRNEMQQQMTSNSDILVANSDCSVKT